MENFFKKWLHFKPDKPVYVPPQELSEVEPEADNFEDEMAFVVGLETLHDNQ